MNEEKETPQVVVIFEEETALSKFIPIQQRLKEMHAEVKNLPEVTDRKSRETVSSWAYQNIRKARSQLKELHKEAKAQALSYGRALDSGKNHILEELDRLEELALVSRIAYDKVQEDKRQQAEAEFILLADTIERATNPSLDSIKAQAILEELRSLTPDADTLNGRDEEFTQAKKDALSAVETIIQDLKAREDNARKVEEERVEQERIAIEQAAESKRLEAERAKIEAEKESDRKAMEAERAAIEEEKAEMARNKALAEKERVDAENERLRKEAAAAEEARLEAERLAQEKEQQRQDEEDERQRIADEEAEQERRDVLEAEEQKQARLEAERRQRNYADPERYKKLANLIKDAAEELASDIISNAVCHYGTGNQKRYEKRLIELKEIVLCDDIDDDDIPLYVQAQKKRGDQ